MTATFNRIFICKKSRNSLKRSIPVINENEIFKDIFYLPLIKAVENGVDGFQDIKTIVFYFINSLETNEKDIYLNLEALQIPLSPKENFNEEEQGLDSERKFSAKKNLRKLSNISYKENNVEYSFKKPKLSITEKQSPNASNLSFFNEPSPRNFPSDVVFDIVESLHVEKIEKKLLVFTSNEQKQCYEFAFLKPYYRCIKCFDQKKLTLLKPTIHENGSKTFDFNTDKHVCEPIEYLPENYHSLIIDSSNFKLCKHTFKGKMRSFLIVFDSNNRNLCYKFGFVSNRKYYFNCIKCKRQNRIITARFIQHKEKTAVELGRLEHLCQPQKYIPENM
uniref:Uncharacterized protein n=1 Tax=Panagrolaimus davidi TaxID=227884 RepID=A0A914PPG8_9BILA